MILDPILVVLISGTVYFLLDSFKEDLRFRKKKHRLPGDSTSVLHALDIALEDDDRQRTGRGELQESNPMVEYLKDLKSSLMTRRAKAPQESIEQIKSANIKTAQYFPNLYVSLVKMLPIVIPASAGIVMADYMTDRIRRKKIKKELQKITNEFDSLLNEALEIAKIKQEIKSASYSPRSILIKRAFLGKMLFNVVDSVLTTAIQAFFPGITHKNIVDSYTYAIVPYSALAAYQGAKANFDTASAAKRAVNQFLNDRTISAPYAATIPALQSSIINKYRRKRKRQGSEAEEFSARKAEQLRMVFKKDISADSTLAAQQRQKQTLEDIYSEVSEKQDEEKQ
jgi:hypothetical protein